MDPNTLRILVATDSHLGYMEKDEVRGHDSFKSFDEVCAIAAEKEVDFMLLGGDLFHDNKPSRTTLVRTIDILRQYCLNDRPVQFEVVSDQTVNFPNKYGHVNYEDPNYKVGLPVFSIHGNHDDPAGVDNLSAIDILSSCNLLNYFGKADLGGSGVGQIELNPILLKKGTTKVALYGLGNIRDERLNRMFQVPQAVQWIRPPGQTDNPVSEWFNLFVIHQNRVKSNPKNAINEHVLAQFLDLVIWGHEHECLIDPEEVPGMGFHITQPGSSVATSLTEGEAAPKHVLLVEIKGNEYRPTKIPLKSVRPFFFADVCLRDAPEVDPNDQDSVVEFLTQKVESMIAKAPSAAPSGRSSLQVPLIRLRVDYTGSSTINPQRFGQKFVGKVANPNDILLFTKAKTRRPRDGEEEAGEGERLGSTELNQQNIEALLAESHLKMEIIPVNDLGIALHDFVSKDEKQAFHVCVHENLEKTQSTLAKEGTELLNEETDVAERVTVHMRLRENEGLFKDAAERSAAAAVATSSDPFEINPAAPSVGRGRGKSIASRGSSLQDFSDDEDMPTGSLPAARGRKAPQTSGRGRDAGKANPEPSSTGRGRGRGSRGGGGGRYKQTTLNMMGTGASQQPRASRSVSTPVQMISSSDDEALPSASNRDALFDDSDSEPIEVTARGRKRGTTGRGRGSQPAAKRGRRSAATAVSSYIEDDIEDDEDEDEDDVVVPSLGRAPTTSQRAPRSWGALRR